MYFLDYEFYIFLFFNENFFGFLETDSTFDYKGCQTLKSDCTKNTCTTRIKYKYSFKITRPKSIRKKNFKKSALCNS